MPVFLGNERGRNLIDETAAINMDKGYLWYIKWQEMTPSGKRIKLPKLFKKWFPCESVTEPFGWEIRTTQQELYMTEVSIPNGVGRQQLTVSGIIDNSDKQVELWFLSWYNSFHFDNNVHLEQVPKFFHHAATLSEFSRELTVVKLNNHRDIVFTITYYVTPAASMTISMSYSSAPKKLEGLQLDIHGKIVKDVHGYINRNFDELFS